MAQAPSLGTVYRMKFPAGTSYSSISYCKRITVYCILHCKVCSFGQHPLQSRKGTGRWFLHKNDHQSHFMSSESTCIMYHRLLTQAYDLQRSRYNLHRRTGLLVADAFTGNFAKSNGRFGRVYTVRCPSSTVHVYLWSMVVVSWCSFELMAQVVFLSHRCSCKVWDCFVGSGHRSVRSSYPL